MLMNMGDPLAHALIYSDLLERALQYTHKPNIKKQACIYQTHPDCLFCHQAAESEHVYIKAFVDAFNDDDFKARYMSGGLICIPQLIKAERDQKNIDKITQATRKKYKNLIYQLSEIRRKNDYRFSEEPWSEQEKTAWRRAVSVINAYKGIKN